MRGGFGIDSKHRGSLHWRKHSILPSDLQKGSSSVISTSTNQGTASTDYQKPSIKYRKKQTRMRWHNFWRTKATIRRLNFLVSILLLLRVIIIILEISGTSESLESISTHSFRSGDLQSTFFPASIRSLTNLTQLVRKKKQYAGYAIVRPGTFRQRYPSVQLAGKQTFDEVYSIKSWNSLRGTRSFKDFANKYSLSITEWDESHPEQTSLSRPPVPLSHTIAENAAQGNDTFRSSLKRHIAYFETHRRIWEHIVRHKHERSLIMDNNLFLEDSFLRDLPSILTSIDQESLAKQEPWHILFLHIPIQARCYSRNISPLSSDIWVRSRKSQYSIAYCDSFHSTRAYILTLAGARFLYEQIITYHADLFSEIEALMKDHQDSFVALKACKLDSSGKCCIAPAYDIESLSTKKPTKSDSQELEGVSIPYVARRGFVRDD